MLRWPQDVRTSGGLGVQVNKYRHVSSVGHQMSLAGCGGRSGGPMSDVRRALHSEVQCIMGNKLDTHLIWGIHLYN